MIHDQKVLEIVRMADPSVKLFVFLFSLFDASASIFCVSPTFHSLQMSGTHPGLSVLRLRWRYALLRLQARCALRSG